VIAARMVMKPSDPDVIVRYLAGELSAAENATFEHSISQQASLREETEHTLKLREGLTRLQERGKLQALLQEPAARRWTPYAAAAAVAVASLAAVLWFELPATRTAPLATSPTAFATSRQPAPPILASVVLARMRSTAPITYVTRSPGPGAIELRALPARLSPGTRYRARVSRASGPATGALVGEIEDVATAADGYVTVYLNSQQLVAGEYELSLVRTSANSTPDVADRFVIQLR